jgi:hypothetical protein
MNSDRLKIDREDPVSVMPEIGRGKLRWICGIDPPCSIGLSLVTRGSLPRSEWLQPFQRTRKPHKNTDLPETLCPD